MAVVHPTHASNFRDGSATDGTVLIAAIDAALEALIATPPGADGADGADGAEGPAGTGMPIVYYTGTVWPARPVSAVPVMWKSLQHVSVARPTGAVEDDEWQRRV